MVFNADGETVAIINCPRGIEECQEVAELIAKAPEMDEEIISLREFNNTLLSALNDAIHFAEHCERMNLKDGNGQPVAFDYLSNLCKKAIANKQTA